MYYIAGLVGAFVLGVVCGWFACAQSSELENLNEEEFMKVAHQIYTGHGSDAAMRDALLQELRDYRKDVYRKAEDLSKELKVMIGRAGL